MFAFAGQKHDANAAALKNRMKHAASRVESPGGLLETTVGMLLWQTR
jgi:hypothetical protein